MITIAIARIGGVARRSELIDATGMNARTLDRELARLAAAGAVVRPRRGLVALPEVTPDRLVAASAGGAITCVSAAKDWELPLLVAPEHAHVAVTSTTSSKVRNLVPPGTVIHWNAGPAHLGIRPDLARAFKNLLNCLTFPEVVAVADAALRRGIVRSRELEQLRPSLGWTDHERLVRAVDAGSQSIGESFARVALRQVGLRVETQVKFAGVGRVDMLVEGMVVVEIDGFAYHSGRREFREDRRRDRMITIKHGLPVLRFSYEDAVYDTHQLVDHVQAAVARRR